MFDPDRELRAHLAATLADTFEERVYAGTDLPDGYKSSDGPAILFRLRGGSQEYHNQLWRCSVTLRVYADDEATARSASGEVVDQINDQRNGKLVWMRMEDGTLPTLLRDPETDWPYMLMYIFMFVRE